MNSKAADRIRAMKDKGTITEEQAEELLAALPDEPEDHEAGGSAAQNSEQTAGQTGRQGAGDAGRDDRPRGDGPGDERFSRRRGPRHAAFLDMEWVGDMVEGITTGLGVAADHLGTPGGNSQSRDDYRYEWDPRWGRRRGGNAESSSRVEQPEGESFDFQDNRVVFSKLSGMRLVRAKVRDNSFSASTLRGAELTDSAIVDSSLAGASVHDLLMDGSQLKDVVIAGSKLTRTELRGGSGLKNVKVAGSSLTGFNLEEGSWLEDSRCSGVTINGSTLSGKTRVKDTRLNGTTVNRCSMKSVHLTDTRIEGTTIGDTTISDTELSGCVVRGVSLHDSAISASRIKDSRLESAGFSALKIEGCTLKNIVIRDTFQGRFPAKAERLSLVDCTLDNVQFLGCTIRDTTIKGIKADGLRIRGKDLSGRTIESEEDLRALSER
jgi:uncharacterized protein YjbI with pentapeptide repeats